MAIVEDMVKYAIAICDDDFVMADCIENIVEKYFAEKEITVDIYRFCDGKTLVEAEQVFDLIFLDVEMPEMDGIAAAKVIYEKGRKSRDAETRIAFLTSHEEVVRKAFQVKAFRFLIKDNYEEELTECLDAFCAEMAENAILEIECLNGDVIKVRPADILFIKAAHNGSELWMGQDVLKCKNSLDKWMDILDETMFFRAHRNNIVNLDMVDYVEDYVYLYNGCKVECSVRNRAKLQKKLRQYIIENAR